MKLEKTKKIIEQAIMTCEDFRFDKIKSYLVMALQEANKVKLKKEKKKQNLEKEKINKNFTISDKNNLDKILSKIDNMIKKESEKIKTDNENDVILD